MNMRLSETKFAHLAEYYKNLPKKKGMDYGIVLDIQDNKGGPAICSLTQQLLIVKGLEKLSLANCDLQDKSLLNILEGEPVSTLRELDLSRNTNLNSSFTRLFSEITRIFPNLISISLKECNLDHSKIEKIYQGTQQSPKVSSISSFDLSCNKDLDDQDWGVIAKILGFLHSDIEELLLADCELKNPGFKALTDSLVTHKSLKTLDLSKNWALHEAGLIDLFGRLVLNPVLGMENLSLTSCNINDNKIKTITETFTSQALNLHKPKLVHLELSGNKTITEQGWKTLGLRVLRNLPGLRSLSLMQCDLDCDAKVVSCFGPVFEKGGPELETLKFSVEAQNLLEGVIVLQQAVQQGKIKVLKPRFLNEELLVKMFWSPLDFLEVLRRFYLKPKMDPKKYRAKQKNPIKDSVDTQRTYGKTLIFEPKTFFPYVFKNPLMNRYEDIVLNEGMKIFLQENRLKSSLTTVSLINYDPTNNDSLLSKTDILRINEFLCPTPLDNVYLDYTYNYSRYNLSEFEMLGFMRLFPPKAFIIKEDELTLALKPQKKSISSALQKTRKESLFSTLRSRSASVLNKEKRNNQKITLNGLKALFATLYQDYNLNDFKIDYDYDSMLNQGIAFSLREKLYQTFFRLRILQAFKFVAYNVLSLFVVSAKHFKFSSDIILLNSYLKSEQLLYILLLIFIGIFYFISIFLPFFFIKPCGEGLAWPSHYSFTGFVVFSFTFEVLLFALVYSRLRPVYLSFHNFSTKESKTWKSKLKRRIVILAYFILSQVAHYDLYSKFSFVRITFECGQHSLGIVAGIFMGIHVLIWFYHYLHMIIHECLYKPSRELNFQHINKFLHGAHFADFAAFHNALDVVAPYNVIQIPDIWIIRKLTPNLAGLSINSKIFFFFLKFLLKNTPIVIVQIMFLFFRRNHLGESDTLVLIALILSVLVFLVDFYKFMSVRPSTIYQGDFDELVRRNKKKRNQWIKENLEERDRILDN